MHRVNMLGLLRAQIDSVRAKAGVWVKSAPIEEVLKHIPGQVFGQTVEPTIPDQKEKMKRILKKVRARVSAVDAKRIRTDLAGLKPNTPAYFEKRDGLSRLLGYTKRQVGSTASGLVRAAKRKKTLAKKK